MTFVVPNALEDPGFGLGDISRFCLVAVAKQANHASFSYKNDITYLSTFIWLISNYSNPKMLKK